MSLGCFSPKTYNLGENYEKKEKISATQSESGVSFYLAVYGDTYGICLYSTDCVTCDQPAEYEYFYE